MLLRYNSKMLCTDVLVAIRNASTRVQSHYDALGVSPKANQNEIKSAYYKLSMLHHPDKTDNDESKMKFRAITAAYEVLGNVKLKKMYDKGLLGGKQTIVTSYKADEEPEDPSFKFYKSRTHRQVTPTMDGTRPIYDFDAWSRHHYSSMFQKKLHDDKLNRKKNSMQPQVKSASHQEVQIYLIAFLVILFLSFALHGEEDYDLVKNDTSDDSEISK